MRKSSALNVSITLLLLLQASHAQSTSRTSTVPASANIFAAGLNAPIAPSGGGAGTLPIFIPVSPGQTNLQVTATGSVSQFYNYFYHGPDGLPNYPANISAYGGISGFITAQCLPLTAVFLTDAAPQPPAPTTLDFRSEGLGQDFLALSPVIGQIFFVGNGQTSGGQPQDFSIPNGATRLFLGFPDSVNSQALPGGYADNEGSLQVSVTMTPEPTRLDISVSEVQLCWNTATNQLYQLQYRSSSSTTWLPLGGLILGDGSRFCTTDRVLPAQPQTFYRLALTNSP